MPPPRHASLDPVPVLRPLLPPAQALAPWLERIDESRWYSNFGPLERLFRERLGALAGLSADQLSLFSTGTAALAVALRASVGRQGGLCLMPSWTHIGSASAARMAGLEPYFLDCDPETWAISPEAALQLASRPGVRAVLPVAPFGSHLDYAAWDRFADRTGLGVVIDAAAGFDQFVNLGKAVPWGRTPVMVSLHATKAFGVGEGGLLLSADAGLMERALQLGNFGIYADRPVDDAFGNFKMSEYSAAIGLAALELWPERRRALAELSARMSAGFDQLGVVKAPGFGGELVSSTCMVAVPGRSANELERLCAEHQIGARRWWREGLHRLPGFAACGREALTNCEAIASAYLGIGYFPDMTDAECERVLAVLEAARQPAARAAAGASQ